MANPLIVDGRNLLDPEARARAGFAYEGIGRPISPTDVLPETPERDASSRRSGGDHPRRRQGRAARRRCRRPAEVARRRRRQAARRLPGRPARARGRRARDHRRAPPARASSSSASSRGSAPEIVAAEEPERLGRGGGIKFAARAARARRRCLRAERRRAGRRRLRGVARARTAQAGGAATITVAQPKSPFGVVDLGDDDVVRASARAAGSRSGSTAASTC